MNPKLFPVAIALAWVTLSLTAFHYSENWNRLPMRIAVHFDANWQPNGWSTRQGAQMLALGTAAFLLVTFTIAAYAARIANASNRSLWSIIAVFYFALGLVYYVNTWIVDRSLQPGTKPVAELILHRDAEERSGFPLGPKAAPLASAAAQLEVAPFQSELSKSEFIRNEFTQNEFPRERNYKTSIDLHW